MTAFLEDFRVEVLNLGDAIAAPVNDRSVAANWVF